MPDESSKDPTKPDSIDRESPATLPLADFQNPPEQIGPYRILETLGEGGMGIVYLAQQTEPVERKVALKVIKLGMDTKEVVARFESERQALALMDHPNIARILEGGVTEQGRPYFVMQHVPGESITAYCDRHRLSTKERLQLFGQVCRGIQHAHQKGIIHRDVKPTNIQVMVQDGKSVPKVIDFGVAKAINRQLTEKTLFTEQGQLIGTPAYMSPEQAEMTGLNVDTTTDIYSLGVLLYELLTGVLPFDQKTLREKGLEEIHRLIREVDPPRPSTRLSGIGDRATKLAQRRRTEPGTLCRQLRGELDWIILKAMEKDRTRRYSSASELAADIERYLQDQPILARPPSTKYQLEKMMRRHTRAVGFAATILVLLVGFGAWMSVLYTRAAKAEQAAASEAETAKQVSDFMVGMFEVVDPSQALGETITAKEILDEGSETIERDLADQPLIQARLMSTMGSVYKNLGLYDQSEHLLKGSLRTREEAIEPNDLAVAESLTRLGRLYWTQQEVKKAIPYHTRALEIRMAKLGPDHLLTAMSFYNLGSDKMWLVDPEARELLNKAFLIFEKELGSEDVMVTWCLNDLAILSVLEGRPDKAVPNFQRVLKIKEKALSPNDPDIAVTLNNLGFALMLEDRCEEAAPILRRTVAIRKQVLGRQHSETGKALHSLGETLRRMRKFREAEDALDEGLDVLETSLGSDNPEVAIVLSSLGAVYRDTHRLAKAESTFVRSLAIYENTYGLDHPEAVECADHYAELLETMNRSAEAEQLRTRVESSR